MNDPISFNRQTARNLFGTISVKACLSGNSSVIGSLIPRHIEGVWHFADFGGSMAVLLVSDWCDAPVDPRNSPPAYQLITEEAWKGDDAWDCVQSIRNVGYILICSSIGCFRKPP